MGTSALQSLVRALEAVDVLRAELADCAAQNAAPAEADVSPAPVYRTASFA
jgi:hypothetical protein